MSTITLPLDEIQVDVAYSVQPAERATLEYPGCPAGIEIESVTIGGLVIADPQSVFSDAVLDRWTERIGERLDDLGDEEPGEDDRWLQSDADELHGIVDISCA